MKRTTLISIMLLGVSVVPILAQVTGDNKTAFQHRKTIVTKPGDTIFSVAREHAIEPIALRASNLIKAPNPNTIAPGTTLELPDTSSVWKLSEVTDLEEKKNGWLFTFETKNDSLHVAVSVGSDSAGLKFSLFAFDRKLAISYKYQPSLIQDNVEFNEGTWMPTKTTRPWVILRFIQNNHRSGANPIDFKIPDGLPSYIPTSQF